MAFKLMQMLLRELDVQVYLTKLQYFCLKKQLSLVKK